MTGEDRAHSNARALDVDEENTVEEIADVHHRAKIRPRLREEHRLSWLQFNTPNPPPSILKSSNRLGVLEKIHRERTAPCDLRSSATICRKNKTARIPARDAKEPAAPETSNWCGAFAFERLMAKRNLIATQAIMLAALIAACGPDSTPEVTEAIGEDEVRTHLPNNFPFFNSAGTIGTHSTEGSVTFTSAYHTPLGTNGRHCGTCHTPASGWSITPLEVLFAFETTQGTHPLFRAPEANNPLADLSTVDARRDAYSMLIEKGVFRRTFNIPATAEYEVIAVDDPYGVATPTRLSTFRRPLVTANLPGIAGVAWDDRTTVLGDIHASLIAQARGNVTGAQQGTQPPAPEVLEEIVGFETALSTAQMVIFGAGRLDACGARGGPEHLAAEVRAPGAFNLYDAWNGLVPGSCGSRHADGLRAQIARGQQLFNTATNSRGGTCAGCHNVVNNGSNMNGSLFNVGASDGSRRTPDMPLYTLRNRTTGEIVVSTDPGRAMITGRWRDMNRFKVPSLRALASRAPYFHNGVAETLEDVVQLYEESLGFNFTPAEEADLVAFLTAL
jgi:hypothetical protein